MVVCLQGAVGGSLLFDLLCGKEDCRVFLQYFAKEDESCSMGGKKIRAVWRGVCGNY